MLLMPLADRQFPDIVLVTLGIGVRWTSGTEGARIRFYGVLPQKLSVITSLKRPMSQVYGLIDDRFSEHGRWQLR